MRAASPAHPADNAILTDILHPLGMKKSKDIINILAEFRGVVQEGLVYSSSPFEMERYRQLQDILVRLYLGLPGISRSKVTEAFGRELGLATANVGVDAAIFDSRSCILLHRRADDHAWGLPGGWVQPHETVESALIREVFEETGLNVRISELISVSSKPAAHTLGARSSCHILFHCVQTGGELKSSHESTDLAFRHIESVRDWHRDHRALAVRARSNYLAGQGSSSSDSATAGTVSKPRVSGAK